MIIRIVLLVILLLVRFYDLGVRPPHHDEAVNGWFVDGILSRGHYQYDPQNYHGPMFFYFLTLFERIFGRSIESLRIDPLLFGALVTVTPILFRDWLGRRGMWIAMFFFAVSPAMVFYSRYSIHEMMFAFSCILYFYFWLRMRSQPFAWPTVVGLGVSLGSMACLKENFVIFIGSLIIAEVMTRIADHGFRFGEAFRDLKARIATREFGVGLAATIGIAFFLIYMFYSAMGRDANGFANFFNAFAFWSHTGSEGNGHQKPFLYWVNLMTQFEWMAMLGLLLAPFALKKVPSELRLTSVVSVGLWLAYSIVNYKTPWCLLSWYWGLVLVAAFWLGEWTRPSVAAAKAKGKKSGTAPDELGFMESARAMSIGQWGILAAIGLGYSFSAWQSWDAAFANPDQDGHPYIYGQTYRDFMDPMNELVEEAKKDPSLLANRRIQVVSTYTWPLPYVLGEYKQVGYYGEANAPAVFDGDVIMFDESLDSKYAPRIKDPAQYQRRVVKSRQWASPMVIYRRTR